MASSTSCREAHRLLVPAAGHPRRRHVGRRHLRARGPQRRRTSRSSPSNTNRFIAAARQRPEFGSAFTTLHSQRAAVLRQGRPRQGAQAGRRPDHGLQDAPGVHGRRLRELLQPLRPQWQVYVQAEGDYRTQASRHRAVLRAQPEGRAGAAVVARQHGADVRSGVHDALQRVPRSADQRHRPTPGYSSGQGMAALEEVFRRDACRPRWAFDYIGHVVPGAGGRSRASRRPSSSGSRCSWSS